MTKTIFLDIDGCILTHYGTLQTQVTKLPVVLPNVLETLDEWEKEGHLIILTTGRKEYLREITEKQLMDVGVVYDRLIMGLNRGERIVINDKKPHADITVARAIELKRNEGLGSIKL